MQSRQGHTIFVILNLIQNLQKSVPFVNATAGTYNENSTFPLMRARLSLCSEQKKYLFSEILKGKM
jgi:hypothetical protein